MARTRKQGKHLFIDTNILLNFYAYSKDDLDQLEKLVDILKTNAVRLYVTQQVVDEFYRNRDAKLWESFDKFRPLGNLSCPCFMTSLSEYKTYTQALSSFKDARTALIEKARKQADTRKLLADKLFKRILEHASVTQAEDSDFAAADRRARLGNPPGKSSSSIGDELNWELLLKEVPTDSDLHLITKDSDYASKLNPAQPKAFLVDEWKRVKGGALHLYEQIGLFFTANFPDEDFSLEIEKRESIDALVGSPNFSCTHGAVTSLLPYVEFLTEEEAQEVVQGSLSNSQVAWIASDSDVEAFLKKMLKVHGASLSDSLVKRLQGTLGLDAQETEEEPALEDDEIPF